MEEQSSGARKNESKQTSFFDFLKLLIMSLISFDSFSVIGGKEQAGGEVDEFGEEVNSSEGASGSQPDSGEESGSQGQEDEKDTDDDLGFGSLAAKELIVSIKAAKDFVMRYVMIVVMFFAYGGIYPTLPIFGVLATMFTLLKYVMFKFRKL